MPDTETADAGPVVKRGRSGHRAEWLVLVVVFVLLVFGYVLSAGPAGRSISYQNILVPGQGIEAWSSAYAPLLWITDRVPLASELLERYLVLCEANHAARYVTFRTSFHRFGIDLESSQ